MISSLSHYFQHIFQLYPIRFGIFLVSLLILYISYRLYRYKLSIRYKITYPWQNYIAVGIYVLYYIVILLVIRFYMFNHTLDLNSIIESIKELHKELGILFIFLSSTLWIFFIVCLIKLRKFLLKQIVKLFISLFFYYGYSKSKYHRFIYENKYLQIDRLYRNINLLFSLSNKYYYYPGIILLKIIPLLLLISLFVYDCYFNIFIITKVFYYLPFYCLYNIWYQITTFLGGRHRILNQVIYERYYQTKDIVYSNITEEEEESMQRYMRNGFKYEYTDRDIEQPLLPIYLLRRYVREPGTNEFYNVETGEGFEIEDIDQFLKESPDTPNV